jgi:predicted metal-dependent hydrolase
MRTLAMPRAPATLDARLQPGRAAFNRGEFFEAHELWEEVWRELAGDSRALVQGLIQIAAGLHHLQRGRQRPAARLLARGVEKISRERGAPEVDALIRDVERLVSELATPGVTVSEATVVKLGP